MGKENNPAISLLKCRVHILQQSQFTTRVLSYAMKVTLTTGNVSKVVYCNIAPAKNSQQAVIYLHHRIPILGLKKKYLVTWQEFYKVMWSGKENKIQRSVLNAILLKGK
jgi:hypothetical protein